MKNIETIKKLSSEVVYLCFLQNKHKNILNYLCKDFTCVGEGENGIYFRSGEFTALIKNVNRNDIKQWRIIEDNYQVLNRVGGMGCVVVTVLVENLGTGEKIKRHATYLWKKEGDRWQLLHVHNSLLLFSIQELKIHGLSHYKKAESKIIKLGNIDILTQIANIQGFEEVVEYILQKNPYNKYVIVTFCIRDFWFVNWKFGYQVGDEIFKEIASCLQVGTQEEEAWAHVEKDIFSLLLKFNDEQCLKKRLEELESDFKSRKKELNIYFRIGLYVLHTGDSVRDSMDKSFLAMDSANNKKVGNSYAYYVDKLTKIQYMNLRLLGEVSKAIGEDEFELYIQPQFDVKTKKIVAGEALVRWNRQGKIYKMPNDFIPLFEEYGVILNFDFYMLDKICKQMREWMDTGVNISPISINQSRLHIEEMNYFNDFVSVVDRHRIPHHYFAFELTESAFVENVVKMAELAKKLHKSGFQLAIDDFGTGYASLNVLSVISADILKIDKELIQDYQKNSRTKIIIEKIIEMAHEMNMVVVCEGVETEQQFKFLASIHCDIVQGFLLGRPVKAEVFAKEWLNENGKVGKIL